MSAARRWLLVSAAVLLLVATPFVVRALPVADERLSALALLHRIEGSQDRPFTGYAETVGSVALPKNPALSSLTKLYGETNRVRVWWADPRTWRVTTIRPTGETDLVHAGRQLVRWVYESKTATVVPDVPVTLPQITDLLPHQLGWDALAGARTSELTRLPARRVAGRRSLGLRLVPAARSSAFRRVDVYADRVTGIPLRVEMYARQVDNPVLVSRYLAFSSRRPAAATLHFSPPPDARVGYDSVVDLAAAADRFGARRPPTTLAGLPTRDLGHGAGPPGSVGVYGRGPTKLLAVPLWRPTADRVRTDLSGRPGVAIRQEGLAVGAPPLRLMLANPEPDGTSWLLFGTVTQAALTRAADQLAAHPRGPGDGP